MYIKDIATLLGTVSLASVRQGPDLLKKINELVPEGAEKLTPMHNGDDLIRIYYDWPLEFRNEIDLIRLMSIQESITLASDVQVATLGTKDDGSRLGWSAILLGCIFVFVSFALVFYVSISIVKDGHAPDAAFMNKVAESTSNLIRTFFHL